MTPDEIRKVADDIAVAIRARGQIVADEARRKNMGEGADLITRIFKQAADVAELRGILLQIEAQTADRKPEPRR